MSDTTLPTPDALAATSSKPFPNEPAGYRQARQALLAEEIALRRHIWSVAEQRRKLPLGGEPPPYEFLDQDDKRRSFADLFGRHDTLVTYFWMYGPKRPRPCPMCTALLGSLDIPARDLEQRVALAVIGRSPVARQLAFARERGWRNLTFYQCVGDDFPRDYRGLDDKGNEDPILAVWVRRGDKVHLSWAAEGRGTQDPGQDPHLAPELTTLWNVLDLTPGGRGTDWYPKLEY